MDEVTLDAVAVAILFLGAAAVTYATGRWQSRIGHMVFGRSAEGGWGKPGERGWIVFLVTLLCVVVAIVACVFAVGRTLIY